MVTNCNNEFARLLSGLEEYYTLWGSGLKKQANNSIRETMNYYDTLSIDIRNEFIVFVCNRICDKIDDDIYNSTLTHEISIRFKKDLRPFADKGILPQARWYCELFGSLDEAILIYKMKLY